MIHGCHMPTLLMGAVSSPTVSGFYSPTVTLNASSQDRSTRFGANRITNKCQHCRGIEVILYSSISGILLQLILHFSIGFGRQIYGFILGEIYHFWAIMPQKGSLCHYETTSTALME